MIPGHPVRQSFYASLVWLLGLVFSLTLLQGCGRIESRNPVPEDIKSQVEVPGISGVRAWGDESSEFFSISALDSSRQGEQLYGKDFHKWPVSCLVLSGGGEDGAFGAGILCGWTVHGDRPRFKMVTGISTGALMAPFAFLGSNYDNVLRHAYTGITSKDIFRKKSLLTAIWWESIYDTQPLVKMLERDVHKQMLAEVAVEHAKGRRLFIGTTELDSGRLVVWDMGAIASRGGPEALTLFRKIMLTSASIPGIFPPQYIKVYGGGREYEEMHVDGGTSVSIVFYENALKPFAEKIPQRVPQFLYIIRNSQAKIGWEPVKPWVGYIGARAAFILTKSQGLGDLYRLYATSRRDKMDYNLAAIPDDLCLRRPKEPFDRVYMNRLFDLGYEMAVSGYPWLKHPPGFAPNQF